MGISRPQVQDAQRGTNMDGDGTTVLKKGLGHKQIIFTIQNEFKSYLNYRVHRQVFGVDMMDGSYCSPLRHETFLMKKHCISVDHSPGTHRWRIVQPLELGMEEKDRSPDWEDVLEREVWANCIPENSLSRLWFIVPCE